MKNNPRKVLRITYNEFENFLERSLGKRHIMTLPTFIITIEKIISNRLRNKMEVDFLTSSKIICIKRDIATSFSFDSTI